MNIFVVSTSPQECARTYCNIHVNKMLLETCQLLCAAYESAPYKRTHYNHPCSKWARHNMSNFTWLEELGNALSAEYTKRRGKRHACDTVLDWIANNPPELPEGELTPWSMCMPDEFKLGYFDGDEFDIVIASYRKYYAFKLRSFRQRGIL
jgi:hypothetical protein